MRTTYTFYSLIGLLFTMACANEKENKIKSITNNSIYQETVESEPKLKHLQKEEDSISISPFSIKMNLSPKVRKKLSTNKETIIADAIFYGIPRDSTYINSFKDGSLVLTKVKLERNPDEPFKFENLKISRKSFEQLVNKDFDVNINFYSGRKSSTDNLLNCEPLFTRISKIEGQEITLGCELIFGEGKN